MNIIKFCLCLFTLVVSSEAIAQSNKEKEVLEAVEKLRKVMVDPDSLKLASLTSKDLIYGHSSGKIENQEKFINKLISGKSDFVSIDITDVTIKIINKTAIVHYSLAAQTMDSGKPTSIKLLVMTTWLKERPSWKMVARQAVKL